MKWQVKWITPELDQSVRPVLRQSFTLFGSIASARACVCGLGIYEMQINSIPL
jgi:alpha-L-rhamnosidase